MALHPDWRPRTAADATAAFLKSLPGPMPEKSLPPHEDPDAPRRMLWRMLREGEALSVRLGCMSPYEAVSEVLLCCRVYTKSKRKRDETAHRLSRQLGRDAWVMLLLAAGQIAMDQRIHVPAAVIAKRTIPRLLSSDPTSAITVSKNAPQSLEQLFARVRSQTRKDHDRQA